ncbi:probable LRR receptor-like serine/threonine-protein kinase At2g16250 [Impatiens glandulifera]|uniref:probable LRR receptor-like serine/threonine-protein kinase At2g16250 n=1 Tax=Impatiens glandulifera TaxID=253017 RepID=UPI001FB0C277|nr:probable LRR receptor-like serine/threonine-protein kinase At2g16250 [Impatiens glandulifera]
MFLSQVFMMDRKLATISLGIICFCLLIRITLEQTVGLQSRDERVSMIQLRSSLGLRSRDWPIKSDPCLNWTGVLCRNGRVVGINISGFKRTRIGSRNPQFSVDALANLTLLESFNASKFLLPGPIPDWFGLRVSSLKVLDLRSSSVTGSIPTSLGNFTNLTTLYLSHNSLIGAIPSSVGQLSSLSVLDLSQNLLSGIIPPTIGTLSKLELLNLSNNTLSSNIPPQMGDLRSLIDLNLSFNSLSGSLPTDLKGFRNLTRLDIKNNSVSGSLSADLFSALTGLQSINLSNNRFSGNLPDLLFSLMPELVFLDISGNNLTGLLPNVTSNVNNSRPATLNLSFNQFYGVLTSTLVRFDSIDLTANYFQGRVPDFVSKNGSLIGNCLTNVSNQRNLNDCSKFYADRDLGFDNFGLPNATGPSSGRKSNNKRWIILGGVLGGFAIIVILAIILLILYCITRKKRSTNPTRGGVESVLPIEATPSPSVLNVGEAFTYQQILQSTDDFNEINLIKNGHSGDLFKGILLGNGIPIVIKRIDIPNAVAARKEAYKIELDFFSKVSHMRLVPFLGHCLENEDNKYLVYKFMPNSDLSSALYWKTNSDDDSLQSLDWITRLKIAIGAAEGLSYLHHECTPPLVHRDVQASSILLDDKFEVRLGSLSEVCPQENEAHQSKITRFLRRQTSSSELSTTGSPTATCAYDVYCFGKVLLELVTGKLGPKALVESETKEWLEATLPYINIYEKELVTNIVDPSLLIDEDLLEEVWAMAIVARSCLNPKPSRRPLMRYILKALENPLKVVREENNNNNNNTNSARLRTMSSRGSWNAALFGSWRASDVGTTPVVPKTEGSSFKQSGTSASQGSGNNGGGDRSSSTRRQSKDIFPEPFDVEDGNR